MRTVRVLNRVSIDGFFASMDEKSWGMNWFVQDPRVDKAARALGDNKGVPLLLMGRVTYKGFEGSWVPRLTDPRAPKEMKAVAEELTKMNKVVFSETLKENEITWDNTKLFNGNLIEEVKKLKRTKGGDIMIMGSGTIVQQLSDEGLIDEYALIMTPVVAGEGKLLFKHVKKLNLELLKAKSFESGNVILHYGIASKGKKKLK